LDNTPRTSEQCDIRIAAPRFLNIYDHPLTFDCKESEVIKGIHYKIVQMDFQYDPNRRRVGDIIKFRTIKISLSEMKDSLADYFFDASGGNLTSKSSENIFHRKAKTYCGLDLSTKITQIQGNNWHGWLAEDKYTGKPRRACASPAEYSSRYRCISLILGNDKMSAAMDKVCLLRKREPNIQSGLSYDAFMEMLKTIQLNIGNAFEH